MVAVAHNKYGFATEIAARLLIIIRCPHDHDPAFQDDAGYTTNRSGRVPHIRVSQLGHDWFRKAKRRQVITGTNDGF